MTSRSILRSHAIHSILASALVIGLVACGGGSDSKASYKIQATVTGLDSGDTLVLQVTDAGASATITKNGDAILLWGPTGTAYDVKVTTPPANPPKYCAVSRGKATIAASDVTDVLVNCSDEAFDIAVSVTGLQSAIAICDRQIDYDCASPFPITADGITTLRSKVANTAPYLLTFVTAGQTTDPLQICTFTNAGGNGTTASGSVQGANVTIPVACRTYYTISGRISGLTSPATVTLSGDQSASVQTDSSGAYSFSVQNGNYTVTPALESWAMRLLEADKYAAQSGAVTVVTVPIQGADAVVDFMAIQNSCLRKWCPMNPPLLIGTTPVTATIPAISGSSWNNVWVATNQRPAGDSSHYALGQWDGNAWTIRGSPNSHGTAFVGIWTSSGSTGGSSNVWTLAYGGALINWNGSAFTPYSPGVSYVTNGGIWGSDPANVWAVSAGGSIAYWNGQSWTNNQTSNVLNSVWGSGSSDVWAVGSGSQGGALHYTSGTWSPTTTGTSAVLYGVWSSGPTNAWAVGSGGTILSWTSSAGWGTPQTVGTGILRAVWGSGPTDIWAVGDAGMCFRWDGTNWNSVATGVSATLFGVWGTGPKDVWAVGSSGTILRWQDQ